MTFTVGETVVYPNHGAAVIEDIETRQIKGEDKQYLVLRIVAQQDLVVRVPACNLDLVGVRDVVDKDGLERVFDVLRAAHTEEPTNWSRRYKANLEKLHSGDVMKVADDVPVVGVVPTDGRGSWPFALLHGESLVAVASWALAEAGVGLADFTASWS